MSKNKIIIIGVILILMLAITTAFAYVNPLQVVDLLEFKPKVGVTKVYDTNNNVTCYIFNGSLRGEAGISCIK